MNLDEQRRPAMSFSMEFSFRNGTCCLSDEPIRLLNWLTTSSIHSSTLLGPLFQLSQWINVRSMMSWTTSGSRFQTSTRRETFTPQLLSRTVTFMSLQGSMAGRERTWLKDSMQKLSIRLGKLSILRWRLKIRPGFVLKAVDFKPLITIRSSSLEASPHLTKSQKTVSSLIPAQMKLSKYPPRLALWATFINANQS